MALVVTRQRDRERCHGQRPARSAFAPDPETFADNLGHDAWSHLQAGSFEANREIRACAGRRIFATQSSTGNPTADPSRPSRAAAKSPSRRSGRTIPPNPEPSFGGTTVAGGLEPPAAPWRSRPGSVASCRGAAWLASLALTLVEVRRPAILIPASPAFRDTPVLSDTAPSFEFSHFDLIWEAVIGFFGVIQLFAPLDFWRAVVPQPLLLAPASPPRRPDAKTPPNSHRSFLTRSRLSAYHSGWTH